MFGLPWIPARAEMNGCHVLIRADGDPGVAGKIMGLNNELSGLLIVSLEQAVAAPYCGLLLADAGARVLKIERPEGDFARGYDAGADGHSSIFAWLNRGKESVCLDLKQEEDMQILCAALCRADVFLSNLAPGAVERLGLTGQALRERNPGLITCIITGYGETGMAARKKAYDFLVQGESGVCSVTGTEEAPARVGVPLTDLSTGMTAFSAILRALIQRGRTGQGIDLSVSMFDVMADWMNMPLLAHRYMGGAPRRTGLMHSFVAPYGAYTCGDGVKVLLSVQNNREFAALCEYVLEKPQLATDPRFSENPERYRHREVLNELLNKCFAAWDSESVSALLDDANIANARVNSVAELSEHPFLRNTSACIEGMTISLAALPVKSDGGTPRDVPALNQHGAAVRAEFATD